MAAISSTGLIFRSKSNSKAKANKNEFGKGYKQFQNIDIDHAKEIKCLILIFTFTNVKFSPLFLVIFSLSLFLSQLYDNNICYLKPHFMTSAL
jgi:hypothetical protein